MSKVAGNSNIDNEVRKAFLDAASAVAKRAEMQRTWFGSSDGYTPLVFLMDQPKEMEEARARNKKNKKRWNAVMKETDRHIEYAASFINATALQQFPLIDAAMQWCEIMSLHKPCLGEYLPNCFGCSIMEKLYV